MVDFSFMLHTISLHTPCETCTIVIFKWTPIETAFCLVNAVLNKSLHIPDVYISFQRHSNDNVHKVTRSKYYTYLIINTVSCLPWAVKLFNVLQLHIICFLIRFCIFDPFPTARVCVCKLLNRMFSVNGCVLWGNMQISSKDSTN